MQITLPDATTTPTTAFTLNTLISSSFKIEYSITRYDGFRTGMLAISSLSPLVFGNQVVYTDDYIENRDLGVTLSVIQDPANPQYITIQYTTGAPLTGYAATMSYSIRYF